MIYDIAGLRIAIHNKTKAVERYCADYLSLDQQSPVDISASVTQAEFEEEKALSPHFPDGYIELSCMYRSICRQLPAFNRMLLHGAVIEYEGEGYIFLGKSGAGKSTHAKLWLEYISGTKMVNGDKPIIHAQDNVFIAYGTPWNGKERLGYKGQVPIKGLCFIEQAKENEIVRLSVQETARRIFTQVLLNVGFDELDKSLQMLNDFVCATPGYLLKCDISENAVRCSFEAMAGKIYDNVKGGNDEN